MAAFASAKKVRGGIRGEINKLMQTVDPMIKGTEAPHADRIYIAEGKLEQYIPRLYDLDREIVQTLLEENKEAEADNDNAKSGEYNDKVWACKLGLKRLLERMEQAGAGGATAQVSQVQVQGTQVQAQSSSSAVHHQGIKRPKIKLPEFSGDFLGFHAFWDLFKASVHDDPGLSEVEKFSYLMGALSGEAQVMLQGYDLTSACYQEAVDALKARYGDPQRARMGHFLAIFDLDRARTRRYELQQVFDQCERHIRSLISLGLPEDTFSVVFVPMILSKLPRTLVEDLQKKNGKQTWKLANLREWIQEELCAYEVANTVLQSEKGKGNGSSYARNDGGRNVGHKGGSASVMVVNSRRDTGSGFRNQRFENPRSVQCSYCSGNHFSDQCHKFPTVNDRRDVLRRGERCYNCLRGGHLPRQCSYFGNCVYCSKKGHHRSLCFQQFGEAGSNSRNSNQNRSGPSARFVRNTAVARPQPQLNVAAPEFVPQSLTESVNVAAETRPTNVSFLPTAQVTLLNDDTGCRYQGRVLLDTASSRSYITEDMCQRLNLKVVSESYVSVGRFGSNKRTTSVAKRVNVGIKCIDGSVRMIVANVTPIISSPVSRVPIDRARFPFVNTVRLAEPLSDKPDTLPLDVLIGSDFYYQFVLPQVITVEDGPTLVSSRLGFLTAGSMSVVDNEGTENTLILLLVESAPGHRDPYALFDFERFWRLEETGVREKAVKKEISDEQALARFYSTLKYDNNRYWVTWFWKTDNPELPDNAKLAYARLRTTFGRLRKTPELLAQYDAIIQNQLKLNVIELAPEIPTGPVYYVPHHEVITPSKVTTKLRIVYDASSKIGKDTLSLNDCMHRGLVVLEDLCGLLLRFRTWKIGIVADIEKAFLQIGLQDTERDVARFYWVRDINRPLTADNVVVYRFMRVFFGAIGSPSLLGSTLDAHARRVESDTSQSSNTRKMAKAFRENVYSDNHVGGEDSEEMAAIHYQETKRICQGASMNLREFYTNSKELRGKIEPGDIGSSLETKVLGVKWALENDLFRCAGLKNPLSGVEQVTKRDVVREVAQVFDPCGWFSPVVLPAKLLIQQLWKLGIGWDEKVPEDLLGQWNKYRSNLAAIPSAEIPRYVGSVRQTHQLHAFCDASMKASAVALYLRTEIDGKIVCNLLMSKTRLAPLNPVQTIPRLELISVELGVRLIEFASEHLRGVNGHKFVWSDSQCVLAWIKNENLTTKFVQRRVEAIRFAEGIQFRFVSGLENPADIPSRGCHLQGLVSNPVWWHGPDWLAGSESQWPVNVLKYEGVQKEQPQFAEQVVLTNEDQEKEPFIEFVRYSKLGKALRVISYVLRALTPNAARPFGPISLEEMDKARFAAEKLVQAEAYPEFETWQTRKRGMPASLRALHVYRDQAGLLRAESRLQNSDLPFDAQNPVILPKTHWFTTLVIRQAHEMNNHAGVAQTLTSIREKYWIVQGKPLVRSVLLACMQCRRVDGGPYQIPPAPPLPEFRVTQNAPFAYTGLDYMGPLIVNTGVNPVEHSKVWISLFTCALVRAVHLEVVRNQSANEFHLALRRFIATYGAPKLIVSDNASQFKTVEAAVQKLAPTELTQEIAVKFGIEWKRIPEVGPWMGGFYERMIGLVKKFLKKSLNGVVVSMSELRTVVAEIQFTVNSRPLLTVEADNSFYSLCPNDFLGKPRRVCFPVFDETKKLIRPTDTPGNVVENWKRLQRLGTVFWHMWRQGYLTSLREKYSNARQNNPSALIPSLGSVVQIKEEKMPRARWLLGTIEHCIPSNDGKVRSVVIRLASGRTLTRPIKLLYPLEMGVRDVEDDNDFEGFDQTDIDRLQNLIQSLPSAGNAAGGTQA